MAADVIRLNQQSGYALSPADQLWTAVCSGDLEKTLTLLDAHVRCPSDKDGFGLLHYAAANNYSDIVSLLIDRGFPVDETSKLGYTPIHLAAAKGHEAVIQILLSTAKCNLSCHDSVHGNTSLHECSFNGYSRTVTLLTRYGADTNSPNLLGLTALHLAAQAGHNECARLLLYNGCNPDLKNTFGDTALHTAARYGHAGVTRILISAHCRLNEQNKNGDTALHIAAALKQKKITKLLLDSGSDISIRNNCHERPLDTAQRKENHEIVTILSSKNYSVDSSPAKVKSNGSSSSSKTDVSPAAAAVPSAAAIAAYSADATAASAAVQADNEQRPAAMKNKKKWSLFSKKSKKTDNERLADCPPRAAVSNHVINNTGSGFEANVRIPPSGLAPWAAPYMGVPLPSANVVTSHHWNGSSYNAPVALPKFPAHINPEMMLTSFYQQQLNSRALLHIPPPPPNISRTLERSALPTQPVYGIEDKYMRQQGYQYYKDLAGHIKKGPVGFAPVDPESQVTRASHESQVTRASQCARDDESLEQRLGSVSLQRDKRTTAAAAAAADQLLVTNKTAAHQKLTSDRTAAQLVVSERAAATQQPISDRTAAQPMVNNRSAAAGGGIDRRHNEHIGYLRSRSKRRGITQLSDFYTSLQPTMLALSNPRPHEAWPGHAAAWPGHSTAWPGHASGHQWSRAVYRSRSDETVSTSSSHPASHHYHQVMRPVAGGGGRTTAGSSHNYELLNRWVDEVNRTSCSSGGSERSSVERQRKACDERTEARTGCDERTEARTAGDERTEARTACDDNALTGSISNDQVSGGEIEGSGVSGKGRKAIGGGQGVRGMEGFEDEWGQEDTLSVLSSTDSVISLAHSA